MNRRSFLNQGILGTAALLVIPNGSYMLPGISSRHIQQSSFELDELTIAELQEGMQSGRFTSKALVEKYLSRIEEIDKRGPAVNAIIEINPDALDIARALDEERASKGARGPMHGIPVLLKDNIGTADKMQTTAGSLALLGAIPEKDAFLVKRLREAGAVILGKTNLSEWANFRSTRSSSGWSGRGGQTKNPYALDRNPSGSSSGSAVAVAANLCTVAVGTETDGSIVSPSAVNGIVGIKPTVGLISRTGVVPISHTQDTAGPMTRTVRDAAILLGAMTGVDIDDSATKRSKGKSFTDYTQFLDPKGLSKARIGVVRKLFGFHEKVDKVANDAIAVMKEQGAVIIDPVEIPSMGKFGDAEFEVLLYEFKADLNAYLKSLGPKAPAKTLKELIEFNEKNKEKEMPYFQQEIFLKAQAKGPLTEAAYKKALAKCQRLSRKEGIDAVMDKHKLDALMAPSDSPAWPTDLINGDHFLGGSAMYPAVAGYPSIQVPAGFVYGLPLGIMFFGRAWSEPGLVKIAYAFEQATKQRKPPRFLERAEVI